MSSRPPRKRAARAIVLDAKDNVAVATDALAAGETIPVGEASISLAEAIPVGHKFATAAIAVDAHVYKYWRDHRGVAAHPGDPGRGARARAQRAERARLPGDAAR